MVEDAQTKRERQKARRADRLAAEAKAAQAARRNRLIAYGLVVVLVLAGVGALIYQQVAQTQRVEDLRGDVAARLEEFGCTEDVRMPDLGGTHIASSAEALIAEPPETLYPDRPPTSGRHVGQVVASGVYDVLIDERVLTHNLEHGYVNVLYLPDAPEDQVEAMKAWVTERMGEFPKIVVSEWYGEPFPDGANFASTAWFQRQQCAQWYPDSLELFIQEHYGTNGEGPERTIGAHTVGQQGVLDPEGEDLLLPPLDTQFGAGSVVDEASEAGVTPDDSEVPTDGASAAATGTAQPAASGAPAGTEPAPTAAPAATATPTG